MWPWGTEAGPASSGCSGTVLGDGVHSGKGPGQGIRAHDLSKHTPRIPPAPSGSIGCRFLLPHGPS